MYVLTCLG